MNKLILKNGNIFDGNKFIGFKDILIAEGRIVNINNQINSDCRKIDMKGNFVCPGFIDIHIHGALGWDFTNVDQDGLNKICYFLLKHGVTSILATLLTAGNEKISSSLHKIKVYKSEKHMGANILGVHLEGPFINEKRKGGMNEQYILIPSADVYKKLVSDYEDIIKTVTLAPEVQGAKELINYLREKEVYISIGHSCATYNEIIEAVKCGANRATHIFNGMDSFNHREPGTAGGLLDNKNVSVEVIADLIHLHPAAVRLAFNVKGADRCIVISDSIEATGLGDGEYDIGGKNVIVKNGEARLKENLSLCGSTITLDQSVKNLTAIGIGLEDALKMVTFSPAKAIGVDGKKGEIKSGCDADIIALDENLNVVLTIVNGEVIEN